jgi:hypothetical protein
MLYGRTLVDSASTAKAPPQGFFRRHALKLGASFFITLGIVYTVHKGGLKFVPEGGDFQHVRGWTVALYVLSLGMVAWFRSVRWRFLLRSIAEVPRRRLFSVSMVGFAAILLLPFRIGEIVRPYMIRTPPGERERLADGRPGRPITLTAATSSVIAERIVDGLYLSVVLALSLVLVPTIVPLPDRVVGLPVTVEHVRMSGYAMFGLFLVAFTTIAVFYFARGWAHRATLAVFGKVSMKLAERLAHMAEQMADGLHVFGRGGDAFGFFVETTLYWAANAGGMWLLAWGLRRRARGRHRADLRGGLRPHGHARVRHPHPRSPRDARRLPGRHLRRNDHVLPDERGHGRWGGIRVPDVRVAVPRPGRPGRRRAADGAWRPEGPRGGRRRHSGGHGRPGVRRRHRVRRRNLALEAAPCEASPMGLVSRRSLFGLLGVAVVAVGVAAGTQAADAKSTYASPYGYDRTWNAALRLVRVDNGWKITEKDQNSGYLLFEYAAPQSAKTTPGSLELVRSQDMDGAVSVLVQLPQMPHYHEQVILDALASKMRHEYGEPPEHRPAPAAPVEPADAGDKAD